MDATESRNGINICFDDYGLRRLQYQLPIDVRVLYEHIRETVHPAYDEWEEDGIC